MTSLNLSIFRLIVAILLPSVLIVMVNVWQSTTSHADKQLNKQLALSQSVLQQVLADREYLLYNAADVLTEDFGFKQAIATGEKGTIESVLNNHRTRISADVMTLLSLAGDELASSSTSALSDGVFPYLNLVEQVIREGGVIETLRLNHRLYQVVMLTVDAPTPVAIALIGFQFDQHLVEQLKRLTGLETTITLQEKNGAKFSLSTLTDSERDELLAGVNEGFSQFDLLMARDNEFVSKQFVLTQTADYSVLITISDHIDSVFGDFERLLINITLTALGALAVALLLALLFARRLSTPLNQLAVFAQNISSGNYVQGVAAQSKVLEFTNLSTALVEMRDGIQAREEKISFQAGHDMLTRLLNRHRLTELLHQQLANGQSLQLVGINVQSFRNINDVFGFQSGDACLQTLAARITTLGGTAARLGGGELVWLPQQTLTRAQLLTLRKQIERPVNVSEFVIPIKLTLAVLNCPEDAENIEQVFRRLNIVVDHAKHTPDLVANYSERLEQLHLRRLAVITELKKALANNSCELSVVYQPKLNLSQQKITGAEALLRWHSKRLGFVSPEEFIALAETAGFIEQVTDWVLARVIDDVALMKAQGLRLTVAINLAAKDLLQADLAERLVDVVEKQKLGPDDIAFEITEGDMVRDTQAAVEQLSMLQYKGYATAIDDFGTGYSSMAYLKDFPVTALKIDKTFILSLADNESDQNIVKAVLQLARGFGLKVIAEGVEDQASLQWLARLGCEYAQGYFIGRPMPLADFIAWVGSNNNQQWL